MACDLRLYDISYASLVSTSVQMIAVNTVSMHTTITSAFNGSLGGGAYGAHLAFPTGLFVYQIAILDTYRVYGNVTIPSLNGNRAGQLEVVLRRLPPATGTGIVVNTYAQLAGYVAGQPNWSTENRQAVFGVVSALSSVRGASDPMLRDFIGNCEYSLNLLGINPAII
jgi:hypothetical protein